jgi:O-succinylbenzoic acid--CoA ligase
VRGPIVTAGYLDRPDATAAAIVDGWLHTGDIGSLDAEGFLYIHDRRDDLIVRGGENVYPAEVEAALLAHASIAEAGVFGVPDEQWGHRAVAVVRLHDGTGAREGAPAELQAYCRSRLAGYKVPSEIRIVSDPLPRTASGKLRRGELRTRTLSPSD